MPDLREDQYLIHAGVAGVSLPAVYSWSAMSGGDVEAQDVKVRPGGMLPELNLGGPTSRTDATVEQPYSTALHPYVVQLENVTGRASMWISYTPLDANGNPAGPTVTLTGKLKGVKPPDKNANNSAAGFLALTMGSNAVASISQ